MIPLAAQAEQYTGVGDIEECLLFCILMKEWLVTSTVFFYCVWRLKSVKYLELPNGSGSQILIVV